MARNENGTQRRPSSSTTPNGPMIAWVTHGQSSPSRYMTPSGCTSRTQPSAGSQDGSSSTSHIPPATSRRPGSVVRLASQAIGKPSASAEHGGRGAHPERVDDRDRGRRR